MKAVFDRIDDQLESTYGDRYVLRPNRPRRGETGNRETDGLFNIGAAFTAGFGSKHGRGYVVEVQMSTLSRVPDDARTEIEEAVVDLLRRELAVEFPGVNLEVSRDGPVYKIHGDLSLGSA